MGEFANRMWVKILAWATTVLIVGLNLQLVASYATPWITEAPWRAWIVFPVGAGLLALLAWVAVFGSGKKRAKLPEGAAVAADLPAPVYRTILVPLDHSRRDRAAIVHAAAMARLHGATLHLLHVEEDVTSRLFGPMASTAEVTAGAEYFQNIVTALANQGLKAEITVSHGQSPKDEIVRLAKQIRPDLIVMGAHGHKGVKDLIFGNTINGVRHEVSAPVLVVGDEPD